jgi:hypothetical protein
VPNPPTVAGFPILFAEKPCGYRVPRDLSITECRVTFVTDKTFILFP